MTARESMLIVCPNCSTSYAVDAAKLGAAGRPVRCARCKTTWQAVAEEPEAESLDAEWEKAMAEAEAPAVAAGATVAVAASADVPGELPPEIPETLPALSSAHAEIEPPLSEAAPPLVPAAGDGVTVDAVTSEVARPAASPEHEDIESVAARRIAGRRGKTGRKRGGMLPLVILALLGVVAILLAARVPIVRAAPQSAKLYALLGLPVNLRGLTIEGVKTTEETQDNVPVLVIEGTIVNITRHTVDVPRLRFSVRNTGGVEVYAWTAQPSQPVLAAGAQMAFRSRLASPPPDAQDIVVRFFNRRDLESLR